MRLFFSLLLLSLPLLLLLGLSNAAPVKPTKSNPTVPAEKPGPPGKCDNQAIGMVENCTSDKPYCLLLYTLTVNTVFVPDSYHGRVPISCVKPYNGEECTALAEENKYYCYCDSRTETLCSRSGEIQAKLQAVAVTNYQKLHPTTLLPTTTLDPTHRCLKGADPLVACGGSSFCHSKIIYNPATLHISNRTGLGCAEELPDETFKDSCRKVESFNASNPIFECFCPSEVGRACNALDENRNKARKDKWDKEVGAMMVKEIVEEEKNKGTEKPKKKKKNGDEKGAFPIVAVFGSAAGISILFLLVVGGYVAFFYRKGNLDRQLKKIAKSILATVLTSCDPNIVMKSWHFFVRSWGCNVYVEKLIPVKGAKKVLGEGPELVLASNGIDYLAMVAETAVDTKLPGDVQMPWNFVDDEQRLIAAQCPLKSFLGEFFLSVAHADVKCIVQLTQRGEKMADGSSTDYLPLCKGSLEQMKVSDATIDVRISAVQDKKSYARRKLHIKVKSEEAGKSGTFVVDHFHYHDWAEDVIPAERTDIFDVVFMVFKASTYVDKRLLVHCRDGIGRTGAFLLVQILLKQALLKKMDLTTDSVFEQAESVRYHRVHAIKEPTQLSFALFTVAGVVMKAADATMEEALIFKKFADSLGDEITHEAKQRAEAKLEKAVKEAIEVGKKVGMKTVTKEEREEAKKKGMESAMKAAKRALEREAEEAAKKAAKAAKKAAEEKEKMEKEAAGGGGEKADGEGNK